MMVFARWRVTPRPLRPPMTACIGATVNGDTPLPAIVYEGGAYARYSVEWKPSAFLPIKPQPCLQVPASRRICLPASIMTSSFSATCGPCSGICRPEPCRLFLFHGCVAGDGGRSCQYPPAPTSATSVIRFVRPPTVLHGAFDLALYADSHR